MIELVTTPRSAPMRIRLVLLGFCIVFSALAMVPGQVSAQFFDPTPAIATPGPPATSAAEPAAQDIASKTPQGPVEELFAGTRNVLEFSLFKVGGTSITSGGIFLFLAILFGAWFASKWLRHGLERYGKKRPEVSRPALYAAGRVLHYLLIAIGISLALSAIGLDLTKLAFFATALGVGIGFGLQGIVNNFLSGLILLFDRSLKIGDFVELESGVTGEVTDISIRATIVTTNDNIDVLVPNSEFVNGRVTNWTLRDTARRIKVKFGVAYGTDKERVKKAALQAAAAVPFTFASQGPRRSQVWLVKFGDSSLEFELVVWLTADAVNRPGAVQAAYYWALEDALTEHGIEIPFPQRDLHVRSLFDARDEDARELWSNRKPKRKKSGSAQDLSDEERRELSSNDALQDALDEAQERGKKKEQKESGSPDQ